MAPRFFVDTGSGARYIKNMDGGNGATDNEGRTMYTRRHLTKEERAFLQQLVQTGAAGEAFMCLGGVWMHEYGHEEVRDAAFAAQREVREAESTLIMRIQP